MKTLRVKLTPLIVLTLCCVAAVCLAATPAAARDCYGFIAGLGEEPAAIQEVRVYDNTAHVYLHNNGVQWSLFFFDDRLRWYSNGLTPGHYYSVRIIPVGDPQASLLKSFTVPKGLGDYHGSDFQF